MTKAHGTDRAATASWVAGSFIVCTLLSLLWLHARLAALERFVDTEHRFQVLYNGVMLGESVYLGPAMDVVLKTLAQKQLRYVPEEQPNKLSAD